MNRETTHMPLYMDVYIHKAIGQRCEQAHIHISMSIHTKTIQITSRILRCMTSNDAGTNILLDGHIYVCVYTHTHRLVPYKCMYAEMKPTSRQAGTDVHLT